MKSYGNKTTWVKITRVKSLYWLGTGRARGWCIYTRGVDPAGFYLRETGVYCEGGVEKREAALGPFDSFGAAAACFTLMYTEET